MILAGKKESRTFNKGKKSIASQEVKISSNVLTGSLWILAGKKESRNFNKDH